MARGASTTDPRVDQTRESALAAARALLVEEGWDAVTHLRVSERAGLGRATIYRHWPEPSGLLHDTLAAEAMAVQVAATGDLRHDLVHQVQNLCDWLSVGDGKRILAALIDRAQWEPDIGKVRAELVHGGLVEVQRLLTDAVARGDLRADVDVDRAVAQLVGPVLHFTLLLGAPVPSGFAESVVDDFLR